ncbi:MAG: hypothetical protein ABIJ53_01240 [Verrucomicrobiota bacterium]
MASVYFKCNCDKSLAVDASDAGCQVQCPDCGKPLLVPVPELYWTCACGEEMSAPKNLAGVLVRCAACEAEHTVPVRLELKRDKQPQHQQSASQSDVPRVPVGRTNEVQCPKCGYMSPTVLTLCPQCQNYLHKGAIIRRQCISVAKVLFVIGLGWFLAANFSSISGYVKGLFGLIP